MDLRVKINHFCLAGTFLYVLAQAECKIKSKNPSVKNSKWTENNHTTQKSRDEVYL